MVGTDTLMWLIGVIGVFVIIGGGLIYLLWRRAQKIDLIETQSDETPKWMRTKPPKETLAATQADGEDVAFYDHDEDEALAAPFAEQIEDLVQQRISQEPELAQHNVDFGTAPDGSLEIWVDDRRYAEVADIPQPPLREVIREAVQSWEERS
jgi:hypothetical protein